MDDIVRAKRPKHLPIILSRREVRETIDGLRGVQRLMGIMLYGSGLRLMECCRLRIQDVDFDRNQLLVRCGKGAEEAASPARIGAAAIDRGCVSQGGYHETRDPARAAALFRDASPRRWIRHPYRPGVGGPHGPTDDDAIYARAESRAGRSEASCGRDLGGFGQWRESSDVRSVLFRFA